VKESLKRRFEATDPRAGRDAPAFAWKRNPAVHHPHPHRLGIRQILLLFSLVILVIGTPDLAMAQASPFLTGATALQTNLLAWLTPIAIILVMVLGGMAMANRMSWGWCVGAILGIAIGFGAPQIVTWVRGMFGV
jgi:type IV secretion system protein VirB2